MFDMIDAITHKMVKLSNGNTTRACTFYDSTDTKPSFGYQVVMTTQTGDDILISECWGYKDAEQAEQDASERLAELTALLNY